MMNEASLLDTKAKTLAGEYLTKEAELLDILMAMRRAGAFALLNYTGIFTYCRDALRLSEAQAYYFKSVAEKAEELPRIRDAVVEGELTLSQARRIVPVVTAENQETWIEKAKTLSQTALEREVTAENPRARVKESLKPVAKDVAILRVPVEADAEADLRALSDILAQKRQRPVTHAEVIAFALAQTRERHDPVKRAERARSSSGKPLPPPKPGRRPVPVSVRHELFRRHGMQCSHVGPGGRRCEAKRWLQWHHIHEVAGGGLNTVDNLRPLCRAHHALAHARSERQY